MNFLYYMIRYMVCCLVCSLFTFDIIIVFGVLIVSSAVLIGVIIGSGLIASYFVR